MGGLFSTFKDVFKGVTSGDYGSAGAKVVGSLFGDNAKRDANQGTIEQILADRAQGAGPRTDAFGNVISANNVQVSENTQPIIDAISGANRSANAGVDAFNTSGFFGGEEGSNNPFNRTNATAAIEGDNQRLQDAFINPALDRFALQNVRSGKGPETSNFGSGVQDEVNRLISSFKIGDEQAINDFIIKNTLGTATTAANFANTASQGVPKPGVDPNFTNLLNATKLPAQDPNNLISILANGAGRLIDRGQNNVQRDANNDRTDAHFRLLLERLIGNSSHKATDPYSGSDGEMFF